MLGENNGDTPCPRCSDPFCHPTVAPGTLPGTGCKGVGQDPTGSRSPFGIAGHRAGCGLEQGAGAGAGFGQGAGLGVGLGRVQGTGLGAGLGRVWGAGAEFGQGAGAGAGFGQGAVLELDSGRVQGWVQTLRTQHRVQLLSWRKHSPGKILIPGQTKGPDLWAASRKAILHLKG